MGTSNVRLSESGHSETSCINTREQGCAAYQGRGRATAVGAVWLAWHPKGV